MTERITIQNLFKKASKNFESVYFSTCHTKGRGYRIHESNHASIPGVSARGFKFKTLLNLAKKYNATIKEGRVIFPCPEREEIIYANGEKEKEEEGRKNYNDT